jgi:hypothetical protein
MTTVSPPAFEMMGVQVVPWPAGASPAGPPAGRPVLLLVAPDADPPDVWDELIEWVRLPADDRDVKARVRALRRRSADRRAQPVLDEHGVLTRGDAIAVLTPIESRIVAVLLERIGAVVGRRQLADAAWTGGEPHDRAVDARITTLRPKLRELGMSIRTVRRHGYCLVLDSGRR